MAGFSLTLMRGCMRFSGFVGWMLGSSCWVLFYFLLSHLSHAQIDKDHHGGLW